MAIRHYTYTKQERLSEIRVLAEEMAGVDQALSPVMYQVARETADELYQTLKHDFNLEAAW